jgi:HD-like signal output (HDOD) protein
VPAGTEPVTRAMLTAEEKTERRLKIFNLIAARSDFPAISKFLAEAIAAARSATASTQQLASLILKDFALTNAILRVVNSPVYCAGGEQKVSTISRAILLIGVDGVVNIAIGLTIFERFHGRANVTELKRLTIRSLLTGLYAHQLASELPGLDPEEAFVCGMLHDLGRLLVALHLPAEQQAIRRLVAEAGLGEEQACEQVLGLGYAELGRAVARSWNLPEQLEQTMGAGPPASDAPPRTPLERLQRVVACAGEIAAIATVRSEPERTAQLEQIGACYAAAVPLGARRLEAVLMTSAAQLESLAFALHIGPHDLEQSAPGLVRAAAARDVAATAPPARRSSPRRRLPGAPSRARRRRIFLSSLEEIVLALSHAYPLNDVLMMVLEGMYRGIGFEHVVLLLVTPDRTVLRGRFGLGPRAQQIVAELHVGLRPPQGLFAEVVTGPREVDVPDLTDPIAAAGLPPRFVELVGTQTCLLVPLVVHGVPIGAFYVDRSAAHGPITEAERRDLRLLANHATLAFQHAHPS